MKIWKHCFYPKSIVPFPFISKLIDIIKEKDTEKYNEVLPKIIEELISRKTPSDIIEKLSDYYSYDITSTESYSKYINNGKLQWYPDYTTLLSTLKSVDTDNTYQSVIKYANLLSLGELVSYPNDCSYIALFVIYTIFSNMKFVINKSSSIWFRYDNHVWKQLGGDKQGREENQSLVIELLSSNIDKVIIKLKAGYNDGNIPEECFVDIDNIMKTLNTIRRGSHNNTIYANLKGLSLNKDIYGEFNKNPNMIGIQNGVLDFSNINEPIFRNGRPEDYITKKAGFSFREPSSEEVEALDRFLISIFPNKDTREYVLDYLSEIFIGGNKRRIALFFTGTGANGKSVLQRLIEKVFADYTAKLPVNAISGARLRVGSATPELSCLANGVRWFSIQEFNTNEELNIGVIKEISGNDSIYIRRLYCEAETIQPVCKFAFVCNALPVIKDIDIATIRRIRVIKFESLFVNDTEYYPDTWEQQVKEKRFPADPNIESTTNKLIDVFGWTLATRLERRLKECNSPNKPNGEINFPPIVTPYSVTSETNKYVKQLDVISDFVNNYLEKTDNFTLSDRDLISAFGDTFYNSGIQITILDIEKRTDPSVYKIIEGERKWCYNIKKN